MVYVVERYLPGLSRANLQPRLSRLEPVSEEFLRSRRGSDPRAASRSVRRTGVGVTDLARARCAPPASALSAGCVTRRAAVEGRASMAPSRAFKACVCTRELRARAGEKARGQPEGPLHSRRRARGPGRPDRDRRQVLAVSNPDTRSPAAIACSSAGGISPIAGAGAVARALAIDPDRALARIQSRCGRVSGVRGCTSPALDGGGHTGSPHDPVAEKLPRRKTSAGCR